MASLFDGSGGFPLAAIKAGIEPIWASEVAPFPIRVTTRRFPKMKHYGDVTKINGAEVSPVDIITFGSPCQDLSIAGRRTGIDGAKSGLFYEAIRIIKEMREATSGKQPRYIVFENVYGAFFSNGGEDFRCILGEIAGIAGRNILIPRCEQWLTAGEIMADDFSIAWRGLNAEGWGVPQRRKRVFLVADFAGRGAAKILFESEYVQGDFTQSDAARERDPAGDKRSAGTTNGIVIGFGRDAYNQGRGAQFVPNIEIETQPPLVAKGPGGVIAPIGFYPQMKAEAMTPIEEKSPTLVNGTCPGWWNGVIKDYVARRLTPTECARLQGFPDWWCDDLVEDNPDLEFWRGVWDAWCDIEGKRHKTDDEIKRWLKKPYSEVEEYKMWGNGVALPCVEFVMKGIAAWAEGKIPESKETLPLLAWLGETNE